MELIHMYENYYELVELYRQYVCYIHFVIFESSTLEWRHVPKHTAIKHIRYCAVHCMKLRCFICQYIQITAFRYIHIICV